ncbi:MAG: homoserine dehydrogenase [Candidatus Nanopelagicales bacterium]|nr:homoserine dehydrogenase [Candidatus Nanopelagicales bacterium]
MKVALLGGGTVGSQVARLLAESSEDFAARAGEPLELVGVAVRDAARERPGIPMELITDDPEALVSRGDLDVVVEVMGGIDPARGLILTAIANGASIVTANKELIATHGDQLAEAADAAGVDLLYEASVAGAIPLLRPLRESLSGDKVRRVLGIVNGTTNYMLTKMDEQSASYEDVLADAQRLGYAEADPTADVGGADSAAKAAILAALSFHAEVTISDVFYEGITEVTAADIASAREMGFVIKLLAIAELSEDERGVIVRVHPAMVPRTHPLASVRDAFNAVYVEAESAGEMMFYGRGAGGEPTASAVLGDVVVAARNKFRGGHGHRQSAYSGLRPRPVSEAKTRYMVSINVKDRPGVLASIATTFADNGVSIQTVRQDPTEGGAALDVRTHIAAEIDLAATVAALRDLEAVTAIRGVMRVEGEVE